MIPYRCTYCAEIRTDTADGWNYHRATSPNHRGPARYSNDPSRPAEPYMRPAPSCPECGGPADTGAGHDCEPIR